VCGDGSRDYPMDSAPLWLLNGAATVKTMFRYVYVILTLFGPMVAAAERPERLNVRAFGAVGDGLSDDQAAITKAVETVTQNKGGVLYFPHGVYRCARQKAMQNAIQFVGVSNVTILFDPGAVLLMDNLNPQTGNGDFGHGVVIRGPCHDVTLLNVAVKWAKKPAGRSMGDAFRFEGSPDQEKCISKIQLMQCSAELSPQVGAIFMGCSDIDVGTFRVSRTYADGLHFNACRRIHINGLTGIETGDDTLSFATYQDDKSQPLYGDPHGPFSRADLGEWNCTGSTATNIYAKGGTANGVRLAGAMDIALSNVIVEGKLRAIVADCGKKEANKHSWSWFASRGITISNVVAIGCTTGFYVKNFNQPMTADDKWWRFGIQISNLNAKDCKDDSVLIADAAGVTVRGVKAENQKIRVLHSRDCTLDGIELKNSQFVIEGQPDAVNLENARSLNLSVHNLQINNGYLEINNCKGLTCSGARIIHPVGDGLRMSHILASRLDEISVD
jgi:hypothetical protein